MFLQELRRKKAEASKLSEQVKEMQTTAAQPVVEEGLEDKKAQALESKFSETYSKILVMKEERITNLEHRLEETMNENQSLRDEISSVRKQLIRSPAGGLNPSSPLSRYS